MMLGSVPWRRWQKLHKSSSNSSTRTHERSYQSHLNRYNEEVTAITKQKRLLLCGQARRQTDWFVPLLSALLVVRTTHLSHIHSLFDLLIADSFKRVERINLVVYSVYEEDCFLQSYR